jgi:phage terminase large subunit GpA-like protein
VRSSIPLGCDRLTCMIDVQKAKLYWQVCAWGEGFTGAVIDYGSWPDEGAQYFTLTGCKRTLQRKYPGKGLEAQIYAGLQDLTEFLLGKEWHREQDNAAMRIRRCLIDANWGESTDIIYDFCRASAHAALIMASHGRGVGASSTPFADYKRKKGDQLGHNWRIPSVSGKRAVRHVVFDSNYWKSFIQARLAVSVGDAGSLTLFAPKSAGTHQMLADHLVSEYGVEVTAKGRTIVEWKLRPERPDNHFLDCMVGNAVAASMDGVKLPTAKGKPRVVKRDRNQGSRVSYL